MATDRPGQDDPFTLPEPLGGGQRQDAMARLPQSDEPELDAYGIPVQDRKVSGRTNSAVTGLLICAIVSALLLIIQVIYHAVPHALAVIGAIVGGLPTAVVGFGGFWHDKLGVADRRILFAAGTVGLIAAFALPATIGFVPSS